jgi:peroxiredoxin
MLQRGDAVPHFTVRTAEGHTFAYASLWQQRNLVLITLAEDSSESVGQAKRIAGAAKKDPNTEWVITRDAIEGVPHPGVLVADRWGEIVHIASTSEDAGRPDVDDLLEWLHFTRMRCPECEGETK